MSQKNAGKMFIPTNMRCGGRNSGDGMVHDDYSEESGNRNYELRRPLVRFSSDKVNPESLNGPVIIVQKGNKKK